MAEGSGKGGVSGAADVSKVGVKEIFGAGGEVEKTGPEKEKSGRSAMNQNNPPLRSVVHHSREMRLMCG